MALCADTSNGLGNLPEHKAFTRSYLIFSSIPNYNKKRPLALSYAILNENPNSVVHLFPMHGERLSLKQK